MVAKRSGRTATRWGKVKVASLLTTAAVLTVVVGLTLWIAPPARAFGTLSAPYTLGCNSGSSSGPVTPVKVGTWSDSGATVSASNGKVSDGSLTSPPTSGLNAFTGTYSTSEVKGGGVIWIGPGTTGCSKPTANTYGETASWTWEVTVYPDISASCTSGGTATASYSLDLYANVHYLGSPYYAIYPDMITQPAAAYQVACSGGGSSSYSPASPVTATYTLTSPPFEEMSGVSYDFQTSVLGDAYATQSGAGFADATVSFTATLTSLSCSGCP